MIYFIVQKIKRFRWLLIFVSYIFTLKYRLFKSNRVHFGSNFITNWKLRIQGPGKAILGNNVIAGAHEEPNIFSTFDRDATIEIGDNCRLNGAHFQSRKGIKIGNSCIIGSALLVDTDHHSVRSDRMTNPNSPVLSKPIEIGNNVWIAGHATILKGVTIGNNSVVGFGSVVASDVPQDSIVAGNPAKVIGKVPMVSGTI